MLWIVEYQLVSVGQVSGVGTGTGTEMPGVGGSVGTGVGVGSGVGVASGIGVGVTVATGLTGATGVRLHATQTAAAAAQARKGLDPGDVQTEGRR
jgi:hypothetical protein